MATAGEMQVPVRATRDAQWPSAGREVHVLDGEGGCRAAKIVRVVGEDGPQADVELFVYPSAGLDAEGAALPFAGRAAVHADEWHWPEYVGPAST